MWFDSVSDSSWVVQGSSFRLVIGLKKNKPLKANLEIQKMLGAGHVKHMPVIPGTWEVEVRRLGVHGFL